MHKISLDVRNFLKDHIQSVWQLDLLIVLMNLNDAIDAASLSRTLYCNQSATEYALQKFVKDGIVVQTSEKPNLYVYQPKAQRLRRTINETAEVYSLRRVELIKLIFLPAERQIS